MAAVTARQGRDLYWQGTRGVLILAVIWIHSPSGAAFRDTPLHWNFDYWVVGRQLINFPVAFFLFLSGYFVSQTTTDRQWLVARARRLMVPFAIWSTLYAAIWATANGIGDPVKFLARIALGLGGPHLYFILVLAQLTLLSPLLVQILRTRWAWTPFLITPAYLVGLYAYTSQSGADALPRGYATVCFGWLAFYYAGLWIRERQPRVPGVVPSLALIAAAVVASVAEAYLLIAHGMPLALATSQLSITSVIYAFAIVGLAFALKPMIGDRAPRWLVGLGSISFGVYFVRRFGLIPISARVAGTRGHRTAQLPCTDRWDTGCPIGSTNCRGRRPPALPGSRDCPSGPKEHLKLHPTGTLNG